MSLQCAISGEPLTPNNAEEVVVTPSGHLCFKRLLLTKLSENGGVDPFSDSDRPLSEDQLVPLQISKNRTNMPPPPSSVSSFSGTLQQISKEYDAVLLELFDTRKALQETRRELSQALYQNDAAIRVIARLSMERDSARQETQQFQAAAATAVGNGNQDGQGPTKKAKIDESAPLNDADLPLADDVPAGDLEVMLATWEKLHQARKSRAKSSYSLSTNWKVSNTQSWHKSTCKGIKAMAKCDKWIASAGKDKSIVVYDYEENVVAANISPKVLVDAIDIMPKEGAEGSLMIVAGCGSEVRVYDSSREELHGRVDMGSTIIHVDSHPTRKHCVGVTADGRIGIFSIGSSGIQHISTFAVDGTEYASGALHPDGLIFAAGTTKGQLFVWDFKNKNLAAKIPAEIENEDKTIKVVFSSNGYHLATAHASGAVRVWDMRKSKLIAELNTGEQRLKSVTDMAFHPDGKYLAYGGQGGVHITMVKEWKISAELDTKVATGLLWSSKWIATSSDKGRTVTFHEQQEE